jgi:hypothetical protein
MCVRESHRAGHEVRIGRHGNLVHQGRKLNFSALGKVDRRGCATNQSGTDTLADFSAQTACSTHPSSLTTLFRRLQPDDPLGPLDLFHQPTAASQEQQPLRLFAG